jgi:plasmid stabilization system protein ParE
MPAADRVIERLIAAYPMLLSMPLTGRNRSDIRADLRCHPMPPYVIFYSVSEKHVNILRVIHGSRHIEAVFEDEPIETFRIDE